MKANGAMKADTIKRETRKGPNFYGDGTEYFGTPVWGGKSRRIRPSESHAHFTNIIARVQPTIPQSEA